MSKGESVSEEPYPYERLLREGLWEVRQNTVSGAFYAVSLEDFYEFRLGDQCWTWIDRDAAVAALKRLGVKVAGAVDSDTTIPPVI
jgi:hypothetical protein